MTHTLNPNYYRPNLPKLSRPRKALRSHAEGTLANIGQVVRPPVQSDAGTSSQRTPAFQPPRYRHHEEAWRPYVPQHQGTVTRRVHRQKPAPNCIHCGGPTSLAVRLTFYCHVEKAAIRWVCTDRHCLGHDDAVVYISPLDEYERRC